MLGLWHEYQSAFVLIDAGTAITFDYVDNDGVHQGGHILPGINTMIRSLAEKTDRINVSETNAVDSINLGQSTETAVQQGALAMVIGYLENSLSKVAPYTKICITGGDAEMIRTNLSHDTILVQNPVLDGLRIYFQ